MVFRRRKKDFRGKALNILGERREYLPERKLFMKIADAHSDTLYAIAEQCGFGDAGSFIQHFKRITGQTPGELRAQYRKRIGEE